MNYYDYTPSLAAAVVFLILFGSVTGYHVWLLLRNKTWFFIVFVLGGICQSLLCQIPSRAYTNVHQHSSRNRRLCSSSNQRKSTPQLHSYALPYPKPPDLTWAFIVRRINLYDPRPHHSRH